MNHQAIVSIITFCYNDEKYIKNLLDSVVGQTYSSVEMTVIDDGSTDESAKIIKSYISKFEKKGYSLKYVYQKNQGQSVAIKNGLKMVKGQYLVCPDADAYYSDKTVMQQMVEALEASDDNTNAVRVRCNVLSGETGELLNKLGVDDDMRYKDDLFEDYLFNTTNFTLAMSGCYMVKMSKLDKAIKGRNIYTEKGAGQNFQIMLPILYDGKCLTIEKFLYNVIHHEDSHSRNSDNVIERQKIYKRTVRNTLQKMPLDKKYRKYLLEKFNSIFSSDEGAINNKRPRIIAKRAIKAVLPYGLIMLYKRRRQ